MHVLELNLCINIFYKMFVEGLQALLYTSETHLIVS